jgi:hypothetical protein
MEGFTWAPESGPSAVEGPPTEPPTEPSQPSARWPTYEELTALLQGQDGAIAEPTTEEPSAALEFLQDLEHDREVEAERVEFRLAPPTRNDVETSLHLGQGAGMDGMGTGAFANIDFGYGHLLDSWEGWAELDKM